MSGVEIEFSLDDGENGTQEEDAGTETETGELQTQPASATRARSRIQGEKWPGNCGSTSLRLIGSPYANPAASWTRRPPPNVCQSPGRRAWDLVGLERRW